MSSICSRVNSQRPDESTNSFFEALYKDKDAEANHICDGLFLGSCKAAQDRKAMQKRGVTHAVIVHPGIPEPHPQHFKYCRAPLPDEPTANLLEVLPDALEFIGKSRKNGGKVFVFCMKGISRSSSVVIAWLMLEKGLGFDEAWHQVEQKRPIVYPNIGFQQQLRRLEAILAGIGKDEPWQRRLIHVRQAVPVGNLEVPSSPLRVRDLIGDSMNSAFDDVEKLADKIFSQPQLLQRREQWKRHGLYFENLHKYKTLPSDPGLIDRARAVSEKLAGLPKVFSDSLKGVKLATAVANQIQCWIVFAEPKFKKEEEAQRQEDPAEAEDAVEEPEPEVIDWEKGFIKDIDRGEKKKGGEVEKEGKKDKKKEKDKKKSKKDKKKEKKEKKKEKKNEKAIKRAGKMAGKIDRLAREAEQAAQEAQDAEADAMAEISKFDAEDARFQANDELDAADAAADAAAEARANFVKNIRGGKQDAPKGAGSSSGSGSSSSGSESDPCSKRKRM